jgi:hypothetical protein
MIGDPIARPSMRARSFANFYFDVGAPSTLRYLFGRDDPGGEFFAGQCLKAGREAVSAATIECDDTLSP